MRTWITIVWLAAAGSAAAVPQQITYQGTLKERGVPVSGSRTMQFRLTNSDGSVVYWSGQSMTVSVQQGHFAAALPMTGVNWRDIEPFIEVSVQGQLLLPREPVSSTAYALMCADVANGSGLTGMIAMFAMNCPEGWTRFSALDGRFPMGGSSYGSTGGSATHHHGGETTGPSAHMSSDSGHNFGGPAPTHTHGIPPDSNIPPYVTVVFCQKQ